MIRIVKAHPEHVVNMTLRAHDLFEYEIAKMSPQVAIEMSIRNANYAWTGMVDDVPACIWGVRQEDILGGANIWIVTSPLVEKYCKTFLKTSREVIISMADRFGYLFAYVDENYKKSARWLEWMNFVPGETVSVNGLLVRKFEVRGY